MHLKRIFSLVLALLMVVYIAPESYSTSATTKKTTSNKLVLEYKDGTRVATIIRGSTINIKALNTLNYGLRISEPLKVTDGQNIDSKSEFNVRVIDDKTLNMSFWWRLKSLHQGFTLLETSM